ncbi:DUF1836 domain-containing protein [Paenibacillus macquariensis]|uniref:DUF1836 domain-containing protein n=1 Tax=Paenibacillus macquariensis TaxID=948756 RepID=A0ABY1K8Q0_9BACL|nr:DUF1836 domain-containing protein [Paenibacillus macquariensis]MEC0093335.1 DUF1836 domain-containing protein [Paenibacillus macquariensis]OAB27509.1 hypothetical protein PMSM_24870 [Paenibacillus macquariensis subsp. macquariensis]SIR42114.1 protein of unknown function [Paenibacillus macquariensis]
METLTFTRKAMSSLLLSLQIGATTSPRSVIQDIWRENHELELAQGRSMSALISTAFPSIIEKMIKSDTHPSFSLHDIVSLGAQIEYTHFSITSVQNWVKRDFKEFIGHAEEGKKYSLQQVALFFIIEDLRSTLDYDSIRKFFQIIFPLIQPLDFYSSYATLFEELDECYRNYMGERSDFVYKWDQMINEAAKDYVAHKPDLSDEQRETLQSAIHVALTSVHTSCFQSLSRRYVHGMVFLHNLH